MGSAPVERRDDDGHHDRGAAHEDAWNGRLRGALGGDDGHVEANHADGGEQCEAAPRAGPERPQPGRGASPGEGQEQQAGESVAEELTARVRVVAKLAVGGEGRADEDTGEPCEQRSAGGGVHGSDARKGGGPV